MRKHVLLALVLFLPLSHGGLAIAQDQENGNQAEQSSMQEMQAQCMAACQDMSPESMEQCRKMMGMMEKMMGSGSGMMGPGGMMNDMKDGGRMPGNGQDARE